jgi:hypothetical protein
MLISVRAVVIIIELIIYICIEKSIDWLRSGWEKSDFYFLTKKKSDFYKAGNDWPPNLNGVVKLFGKW